jgi:hypothetical protein
MSSGPGPEQPRWYQEAPTEDVIRMSTPTTTITLTAAEVTAEALFASYLQPSDHPTPEQVSVAVRDSLRRGGEQGCAGVFAAEYGDHPEAAQQRMRWAIATTRVVTQFAVAA